MEAWRRELFHSELWHYGTKHHSGRYPYGSGDRPYQDRETARYINREVGRIDKTARKSSKAYEKATNKVVKKYNKELDKYGTSRKEKLKSLADNYEKNIREWGEIQYLQYSERRKVARMSAQDIKAEQLEVGGKFISAMKSSNPPKMKEIDSYMANLKRRHRLGDEVGSISKAASQNAKSSRQMLEMNVAARQRHDAKKYLEALANNASDKKLGKIANKYGKKYGASAQKELERSMYKTGAASRKDRSSEYRKYYAANNARVFLRAEEERSKKK